MLYRTLLILKALFYCQLLCAQATVFELFGLSSNCNFRVYTTVDSPDGYPFMAFESRVDKYWKFLNQQGEAYKLEIDGKEIEHFTSFIEEANFDIFKTEDGSSYIHFDSGKSYELDLQDYKINAYMGYKDYFCVGLNENKHGPYGIVDRNGQVILPLEFSRIWEFNSGPKTLVTKKRWDFHLTKDGELIYYEN